MEIIEHLRFLINQTEERIRVVDSKASIIIAFFALLIGSNSYFQSIVTIYSISLVYCYGFIGLLLISFVFLVLTIRPISGWKFLVDIKLRRNMSKEKTFWVENKYQAKSFDIKEIQGL